MHRQGTLAPSGATHLRVLRGGGYSSVPPRQLSFWEILRLGFPHFGLAREVALWRLGNIPNLLRGLWRVYVARFFNLSHFYGQVSLAVIKADGRVIDYGLASLRVVTTAGVNAIVDAFQNSFEVENLKYHGLGTGTNAEASGDTALQTELTTEYNPNNTRATGSTTEGAAANVYRTVGTNTVDASAAVTEHGIFSQAATGGGTLLDRSVFSVINLANGDSLQTTYDLTFSAGG
jgi:hypothetical protein